MRDASAAPAAGGAGETDAGGAASAAGDAAAAADAARAELRAALAAGDEPALDVSLPREARGAEDRPTLRVRVTYSAGAAPGADAAALAASPLRSACASHGDFLFLWGTSRAVRCWAPVVDDGRARSAFTLRLSVPADLLAIGPGALAPGAAGVVSEAAPDGPRRRFSFATQRPCLAAELAVAVGPFVVLPDARAPRVQHLAPPGRLRALRCTAAVLSSALGVAETALGAPLPLDTYTQVFLPAQAAPWSALAAPGVAFLSESLLVDERMGAEAAGTHLACCDCLAKQFFGFGLAPAGPRDAWITAGLAGSLARRLAAWLVGEQEAAWRAAEREAALAAADDGALPPLAPPDGTRFGALEAAAPHTAKLLAWKAEALLGRLERRVGDEPMAKLLRALFTAATEAQAAADAPSGAAPSGATGDGAAAVAEEAGAEPTAADALAAAASICASAAGDARLLSADAFLTACCRVGALDRGEVAAFLARYVTGRGLPVLHSAYYYIKQRNSIDVGLRLDGSPAALASAKAAARASSATGWVPASSVRVHEVTTINSFAVSLGSGLQVLRRYHCVTRFQMPGSKKGGLTKRPPPNPDGGAVGKDAEDSPVLWVRCDPERAWLGRNEARQAEAQWISQLAKEKDVAAQGAAASALAAAARRGSFCAVNALVARLKDGETFCRVRGACAAALGATASARTAYNGLDALLRFYKASYYEPTLGRPSASALSDLGEAAVARAALAGLAAARGPDGATPPEAFDALLEACLYPDDGGGAFDGGGHTAAALAALAAAAPPGRAAAASAAAAAERHLKRDRLMPSHRNAVSAAALRLLAALAAPAGREARRVARATLRRYQAPGNAPPVRRAAAAAAVALAMGDGVDAARHAGDAAQLPAAALAAALTEAAAAARDDPHPWLAARILEDTSVMLLAAAQRAADAQAAAAAAAKAARRNAAAAQLMPPPPPPAAAPLAITAGDGGDVKMEDADAKPEDVAIVVAEPVAPPPPALAVPVVPTREFRMPHVALPAGSPEAAAVAWLRERVRDAAAPAQLAHAAFELLQVLAGRPPSLYDPAAADAGSIADPEPTELLGAPVPPPPPPPPLPELPDSAERPAPPPRERARARTPPPPRVRAPPQPKPKPAPKPPRVRAPPKKKADDDDDDDFDEDAPDDDDDGEEAPRRRAAPSTGGRTRRGPPQRNYAKMAGEDEESMEDEDTEDEDGDSEDFEVDDDSDDSGGGKKRKRGGGTSTRPQRGAGRPKAYSPPPRAGAAAQARSTRPRRVAATRAMAWLGGDDDEEEPEPEPEEEEEEEALPVPAFLPKLKFKLFGAPPAEPAVPAPDAPGAVDAGVTDAGAAALPDAAEGAAGGAPVEAETEEQRRERKRLKREKKEKKRAKREQEAAATGTEGPTAGVSSGEPPAALAAAAVAAEDTGATGVQHEEAPHVEAAPPEVALPEAAPPEAPPPAAEDAAVEFEAAEAPAVTQEPTQEAEWDDTQAFEVVPPAGGADADMADAAGAF
jgi:hypothetical protein